jgi:DNA polymerase-3 subunit alpha
VLEALVQCGAFDVSLARMGIDRARALASVDRALERGRSASRDREAGQTTLFGLFAASTGTSETESSVLDYCDAPAWDRSELLKREKQALGCYVSGHPLDRYGNKPAKLGAVASVDIASQEAWTMVRAAGIVEGYEEKRFKGSTGGKAAFFELEDMRGRVRAKVRGDKVDAFASVLTAGEPVIVTAKVSFPMTDEPSDEKEPTLLIDEVVSLADEVTRMTRAISIPLKADEMAEPRLRALKELLREAPGTCAVDLVVELPDGVRVTLALDGMRVIPHAGVLGGVERVFPGCMAELH